MAGKRVVARLGGLVAMLGLCFALFVVPSAYAVAMGKPHWFAWAVGLLAFPALPLVWNVLSERKRVANPKATTTRWERITMRTVFVGVVVIGGLFGIGRGKTWRAVLDHALWFIPHTPGALVPDSALLQRVPAGATTVIWLRDTDVAQGLLAEFPTIGAGSFELVIAFDDKGHAYFSERGDIHFAELMAAASHHPWLQSIGFAPTEILTLPDGSRTWSTKSWTGSTPPTALIDQMRVAPSDAFLIGATRDEEIVSGVGWLAGRDGELEAAGELTARTEAAAQKFVAEADREMPRRGKELACWTQSGGTQTLTRDGVHVRGRAAIAATEIQGLFMCLDLKK